MFMCFTVNFQSLAALLHATFMGDQGTLMVSECFLHALAMDVVISCLVDSNFHGRFMPAYACGSRPCVSFQVKRKPTRKMTRVKAKLIRHEMIHGHTQHINADSQSLRHVVWQDGSRRTSLSPGIKALISGQAAIYQKPKRTRNPHKTCSIKVLEVRGWCRAMLLHALTVHIFFDSKSG